MKKYQAVIFDLDGTLLNTLEDLADSTNYALRQMNYPERTIDEVRRFVGNGVEKLMERAVPTGTSEDDTLKALAIFKKHYSKNMLNKTGLPFHGEAAMVDDTYLVGKVGISKEHPFVEHFKFVKQFEDENTVAKQTMPSPAQFLAQFTMPFNRVETEKYYTSDADLVKDIVDAYGKVIQDLYNAGCRNIQLDDCTWGMMADRSGHLAYGTTAEGLKEIQKIHKDINNQVIANAPKDLTINTHVCRGNFHSTYANSGAYDPVADILFGEENVNAYYLEFDDERSGGFAPLAKVSGDKKVVLGLITTKSPKLENKEEVIARIKEAANYIPLDRLYLSPQCGFASCEIGNKLTEKEQWDKLRLVKEIAEEVW